MREETESITAAPKRALTRERFYQWIESNGLPPTFLLRGGVRIMDTSDGIYVEAKYFLLDAANNPVIENGSAVIATALLPMPDWQ